MESASGEEHHGLVRTGMCWLPGQAGEGEDGRMKSAIGIGALLMDGLGDTIRVSLTEDPELEIVPCRCDPKMSRAPCTRFAHALGVKFPSRPIWFQQA